MCIKLQNQDKENKDLDKKAVSSTLSTIIIVLITIGISITIAIYLIMITGTFINYKTNNICIDNGYNYDDSIPPKVIHGKTYSLCYNETITNGIYNLTERWIPHNQTK